MSCGVGCRHSLNLALLWLWHKLAAVALIRPLAWDPPWYCRCGPKKKKRKKEEKRKKKAKLFLFFLTSLFKKILWPHSQHMEVPCARDWIWATAATYTGAAATPDPLTHCTGWDGIEPAPLKWPELLQLDFYTPAWQQELQNTFFFFLICKKSFVTAQCSAGSLSPADFSCRFPSRSPLLVEIVAVRVGDNAQVEVL